MRPFHELKYEAEFSRNSIAAEECIAQPLVQTGPENLTLRSVSVINCCVALTEKAILHAENIIARY
jgi:hypothetical protein